jgi:hypothetical protein
MHDRLERRALDQLFRTARTHSDWLARPIAETDIRELYELLKMGCQIKLHLQPWIRLGSKFIPAEPATRVRPGQRLCLITCGAADGW